MFHFSFSNFVFVYLFIFIHLAVFPNFIPMFIIWQTWAQFETQKLYCYTSEITEVSGEQSWKQNKKSRIIIYLDKTSH